jgi:hypothetical protein
LFSRRPARKPSPVTRRPVRPAVEALEPRLALSGNVTASLVHGTLTLTGDPLDNHLVISQPGPHQLTITPADGTTVNGQAKPLTLTGFTRDLRINLGPGNDDVDFDLANPLTLPGNLTIDYGAGGTGNKTTQTVNAGGNFLTVTKNLVIRYAAGNVTTQFDNLHAGGNVSISHGLGDSAFTIDNLAGADSFSTVHGNLRVVNTQGRAANLLQDTNVSGNVTFANGQGRAADHNAGLNVIHNAYNHTTQATIGGNLTISNLSGDADYGDFIADVDVKGNATLNLGSGTFAVAVVGQNVVQPPVFEANLTITGAGSDTIFMANGGVGLRVLGRLNIRTGDGPDSVTLNDVFVRLSTSISTGGGDDTVLIDPGYGDAHSVFGGAFLVNTGGGNDTLHIKSDNSDGLTDFKGAVRVNLGDGDDSLVLAAQGHVAFEAAAKLPVVFDGGTGTNTNATTGGNLPSRVPTFLHFV